MFLEGHHYISYKILEKFNISLHSFSNFNKIVSAT